MAYFAVIYTYADEPARLDEHRPTHRAFLRELAEAGTVVASGPLLDTHPATALLLVRGQDEQVVRATLAADPFQQLGLVARTDVMAWDPVIGILAARD